jgi:Na+-driven multidrug efflux pump
MGRTLYPLLGQAARVLGFAGGLAVLVHGLGWGLAGIFWSYTLAFAVEFAVMGGALGMLWRLLAQAPPGVGRRAA